MTYSFQADSDGLLTLRDAVFQALGAASMCWSETPTGVFDPDLATEIGDALMAEIERQRPTVIKLPR